MAATRSSKNASVGVSQQLQLVVQNRTSILETVSIAEFRHLQLDNWTMCSSHFDGTNSVETDKMTTVILALTRRGLIIKVDIVVE